MLLSTLTSLEFLYRVKRQYKKEPRFPLRAVHKASSKILCYYARRKRYKKEFQLPSEHKPMKYRPRYCPIAWDKSTLHLINKTIKRQKRNTIIGKCEQCILQLNNLENQPVGSSRLMRSSPNSTIWCIAPHHILLPVILV